MKKNTLMKLTSADKRSFFYTVTPDDAKYFVEQCKTGSFFCLGKSCVECSLYDNKKKGCSLNETKVIAQNISQVEIMNCVEKSEERNHHKLFTEDKKGDYPVVGIEPEHEMDKLKYIDNVFLSVESCEERVRISEYFNNKYGSRK